MIDVALHARHDTGRRQRKGHARRGPQSPGGPQSRVAPRVGRPSRAPGPGDGYSAACEMSMLASSRAMRTLAPPMRFAQVRAMSFRSRPSVSRRVASRLVTVTAVVAGAAFGVYCLDSRAGVHRWLFPPLMQMCTDPETGSKLSIKLLQYGLAPRDCGVDDEVLRTELFGRTLSNPIGLAAGFDKQAEAIDGLFDLGFGIVEIGSVTPEPQPGNPQPRMFRLPLDGAVINRMGFNSDGHEAVRERLHMRLHRWVQRVLAAGQGLVSSVGAPATDAKHLTEAQLFAKYPDIRASLLDDAQVPRSLKQDRLLSINLGKNKTSREDSVVDYVKGVETLGPYADMVVINVSSPNTPGLRRLQRRSVLEGVLRDVITARDSVAPHRTLPLLVKVAPDLSDAELEDVADAARATKTDGIIVSNTTVSRPAGLLSHEHVNEAGGLSGPPVKPLALHALEVMYARTEGRMPLIGCGGILTADDALDFARAGASAVQLYTGLAYRGPGLPRRIKDDLAKKLRAEGRTWSQVVGTGLLQRAATYAPDAVEHVGLYPGAQDAFERSVASVRHEIEQLRESFQHEHVPEERRALPFDVEAHDDEFKAVLAEAHKVTDDTPQYSDSETPHAGVLPQRDSAVPDNLLLLAKERGLTQGEMLQEAVHESTTVPEAHSQAPTSGATTLGGLQAPLTHQVPKAFQPPKQERVV